jgi:hypothetical protein
MKFFITNVIFSGKDPNPFGDFLPGIGPNLLLKNSSNFLEDRSHYMPASKHILGPKLQRQWLQSLHMQLLLFIPLKEQVAFL